MVGPRECPAFVPLASCQTRLTRVRLFERGMNQRQKTSVEVNASGAAACRAHNASIRHRPRCASPTRGDRASARDATIVWSRAWVCVGYLVMVMGVVLVGVPAPREL
jgi:hypothetical protein